MKTESSHSSFTPRSKGFLFGLLLVVAGSFFLSFNFGWIDATLKPILFFWPLLLILLGLFFIIRVVTCRERRCSRKRCVNVEKILPIELYEKHNQMLTLINGDQIRASVSGYKGLRSMLNL